MEDGQRVVRQTKGWLGMDRSWADHVSLTGTGHSVGNGRVTCRTEQ